MERSASLLLPKLDSTLKEVYGICKQGADDSYIGTWAYHPLLFTLAETGEALRPVNRPGNRPGQATRCRHIASERHRIGGGVAW